MKLLIYGRDPVLTLDQEESIVFMPFSKGLKSPEIVPSQLGGTNKQGPEQLEDRIIVHINSIPGSSLYDFLNYIEMVSIILHILRALLPCCPDSLMLLSQVTLVPRCIISHLLLL